MKDLTTKEIEILLDHFYRDYEYGVAGTWGDGENWTSGKIARTAGARAIMKLQHELKLRGLGLENR